MSKFNLRPEEKRIYEQLAKGKAKNLLLEFPIDSKAISELVAGKKETSFPPVPNCENLDSSALVNDFAQLIQSGNLLEIYGYRKLNEHGKDNQIYYLAGVAYNHGARSYRQIAEMLNKKDSGITDPLALQLKKKGKFTAKKISKAINNLGKLVQTPLVKCTPDTTAFVCFNKQGELLWKLISDSFVKYYYSGFSRNSQDTAGLT